MGHSMKLKISFLSMCNKSLRCLPDEACESSNFPKRMAVENSHHSAIIAQGRKKDTVVHWPKGALSVYAQDPSLKHK